jgi:hypothetical protein
MAVLILFAAALVVVSVLLRLRVLTYRVNRLEERLRRIGFVEWSKP